MVLCIVGSDYWVLEFLARLHKCLQQLHFYIRTSKMFVFFLRYSYLLTAKITPVVDN